METSIILKALVFTCVVIAVAVYLTLTNRSHPINKDYVADELRKHAGEIKTHKQVIDGLNAVVDMLLKSKDKIKTVEVMDTLVFMENQIKEMQKKVDQETLMRKRFEVRMQSQYVKLVSETEDRIRGLAVFHIHQTAEKKRREKTS